MDSKKLREIVAKHQHSAPVKTDDLARDLGLPVEEKPMPEGVAGQIKRDGKTESGFRIFVNEKDSPRRRRFTIAHEVAHFLLHRNLIGDGITDENEGEMYRSNLRNEYEIEANHLASDIIMPVALVRKARADDPAIDWKKLADLFEVSPGAMQIRLKQIKWNKARSLIPKAE